jgi:hypothetical protein
MLFKAFDCVTHCLLRYPAGVGDRIDSRPGNPSHVISAPMQMSKDSEFGWAETEVIELAVKEDGLLSSAVFIKLSHSKFVFPERSSQNSAPGFSFPGKRRLGGCRRLLL